MVAHDLEGNDLHVRAIIRAHRHQRHRKRIVFRFLENDGLFFSWRTKMPYAAIFPNRPFEYPPASVFLLEEGMFLRFFSHILTSLKRQRHHGSGQMQRYNVKKRIASVSSKKVAILTGALI